MKILLSPRRIFLLLHETTYCYILEHLYITRLSKKCNDKKKSF